MLKFFVNDSKKIKNFFLKGDIIAYAALLIVIAVLFVVFVIFPTTASAIGFKAQIKDKTVFSFDFKSNSIDVSDEFIDLVKTDIDQDKLLITVFISSDYSKYNVISIDKTNKSIKVTDSTCSSSKDCVHSPAITNSGVIYCAPHFLKITPLSSDNFQQPIVG